MGGGIVRHCRSYLLRTVSTELGFDIAVRIAAARGRGQDRAFALHVGAGLLVGLADGVGGRPGGERAAERLLELAGMGTPPSDATELARILRAADRTIAREGGGETTGVLIFMDHVTLHGASVGDSIAWHLDDGAQVDLTEGQERRPMIGSGHANPIPFTHRPGGRGTLLVASDGLWKYAPLRSILDVARMTEVDEAGDQLLALPTLRSGLLMDDVALVLVRARGNVR